ncbi:MAG: ATP-binding cassette domain-containing protein [Bacteroidia bacterium]|nr:ATP-binding cassette domain-containing protein [Bacteroidia bacterium]
MAQHGSKDLDLPKVKINKSNFKLFVRIFNYAGTHTWKFYLGLVFLGFTGATALLFPKYMGNLVDCAKNSDMAGANNIVLFLGGVLVLQAIFSYFRIYLFVNYTSYTLANLRLAMYSHVVKLPITFFTQNRVGEINSRISNDISQIQETLTTTIAEFLRQVILIVGGIIFLSYISIKLTLLMLCIVPLVAIAAVIFGRFIRKNSREIQDQVAESNTIVEETLQAIANVKSFANELFEINRYETAILNVARTSINGGKYRGYFASFIIFCLFGSIVVVLWYGVVLAISKEISVGELLSFLLYSTFVGAAFGGIAELYATLQKTAGASERVFEIIDEEMEALNFDAPAITINGDVEFKNAQFTYPSRPESQVLNNLSFTAKAGERIAIVGSSGAGKSTLAQLLLRFYNLDSGTLLIDGKDSQSYDLHALRNNMAMVPQDVILFGGTIRENIAYGKPNAEDFEIIQAAQRANAWEFIQTFSEGLATVVGERGVKLSGGQRQRIAIARALLKDPRILLLDEATSALDSESERVVQAALDELMKGRTSIIIAHRLSTIRDADKIVVLDKGQVVEQGTHTELMQIENGFYKHLSVLQGREV